MSLKLYNSLTRRLEIFKPIKKESVGLYTCGPTVYNYAHLGNLRTYIFEDVLKRVLLYNGCEVKHVMNITDVGHLTSDADEGEDKMEQGAEREGKTAWEIAEYYANSFKRDLAELNILPPDIWCKATDHIAEQIGLIKKIEKNGYAYKTSDGIYFDSAKFKDYGKLANLSKQNLLAGKRVKLGEKKNATDFALWKFSPPNKKRQMEWDSPWGKGFPGWHIECSAMSVKYLGQPFDVHCGGIDHVPVHHTNEMAQSQAATGKRLANFWLHGEYLIIPDGKMAKSENNFITLRSVKEKKINVLSYRYLLLQTHYRKQLMFSWETLKAAERGLRHFYECVAALASAKQPINDSSLKSQFLNFINNDLDLPNALAMIWEALKNKKISAASLLKFDEALGLRLKEQIVEQARPLPLVASDLLKNYELARKNKNWEESDALRDKLKKMGYKVEDRKDGSFVSKINM